MSRSRAIVALLALVLALPSSAFAQGAGDEQYQDPFGDEQAQNDGGANGRAAQDEDDGLSDDPPVDGGGGGETGGGDTGGVDTGGGDAAGEEEAAPAEEPKSLPDTGSDPRLLALAGVLFLMVGAGLRLRTIDPDDF